ncbi:MFS transporter [Mycobacterium sp. C31M]
MTSQDRPARPGITIGASFASALMFGLEISSVPVSLPAIGEQLSGGFADLQWVMNAYTIASVMILVAAGVLADRYGRRLVFSTSVTGFGIASLLCGLAPEIEVLIAARFIQGIAGGAMVICGLAILSHQFQESTRRAQAFGIWGIGLGSGLGFGPIIGGALVAWWDWRWVFLIHVIIAMIALVLIVRWVPESRDVRPGRLDVLGITTLSLALFTLVFFITHGPTAGFASATAVISLVIAVLGFASFAVVELRAESPMMPLSLFTRRPFTGALVGAIAMNFSFWPLIIYLPMYLERALHYSVLAVAIIVLGYTLPTFVLPPLGERLALRFGAARTIPAGIAVIGTGMLLIDLGVAMPQPGWWTVLPGLIVAGVGLGLTNTPVTNTTTGSVPPQHSGMASGIDLTARLSFLAINIAVMGALFTESVTATLRDRLPSESVEFVDDLALQMTGSGHNSATAVGTGTLDALAADAIRNGFGAAALYGGTAAVLLAIASRLIFGSSVRRNANL